MDDAEREIEASWRANAAAWTTAVRDELIESRRVATNHAVIEAVLERRPRSALDVGCGEGWLAHRLESEGVRATGFDSSAELVDAARSGAGSFHVLSYAEFVARPGTVGGGFDVVVCNFSLLGERIEPVLRACREVLATDGALIIQTVHPASVDGGDRDGWRREHFGGMGAAFAASMPWYFRTLESWTALLRRAGFERVEAREPMHPASRRALSLLLVADSRRAHA